MFSKSGIISRNVAMTIDYRGKNDDVLTLMFGGVDASVLRKVFTFLCGRGNGVARDFTLSQGCSPVWRGGFLNEWMEVTLQDRNDSFASIEDVMLMAESLLAREVKGRVDRYEINDFLNLSHHNEKLVVSKHVAPQKLSYNETTEMILNEYPTTPTKVLAQRYGRSISAIDTMACRHGITKMKYC